METSNTKLRVAHIITMLELGGAQRNTLYTVGHLNAQRFAPTLICGKGGILDKETAGAVWPTIFVRPLIRRVIPFMDLPALIILYRHLRRLKPHIVHTHSSKAGILGRIAAYIAGVPVIVHTYHGFGFTPRQSEKIRTLYVKIEKFCALLSTHLIFVSEDNRREAAELGIGREDSSSLIRSGIEMGFGLGGVSLRRELGIAAGDWVVACVGNFKPQKNPVDLVKVAEQVLAKVPTIHFLLVGDGEKRSEVETYISEHGLASHVHLLGWREDIPSILASSNSFLLTSLWEGLPRALVEAFRARLPAVAYGVNGVRDILRDNENGFLIPAGDIVLAAEKILWLENHPLEALDMGRRGHDRVIKEFDINQMVRQQEELYAKLYEAVPLRDYYEPKWKPEETTHA